MKSKIVEQQTFYILISTGYAAIFLLLISIHLFTEYSIKKKISDSIVASARSQLFVRSLRRLQENLDYHATQVQTFDSIKIESPPILGDNHLLAGQKTSRGFRFQCFDKAIFFDTNHRNQLGFIEFCYNRLNGFTYGVFGYFLFVILTVPVMNRYRRSLLRSMKVEKEAAIGRISAQLTHDMRAPIGTFERLLLTSDEDIPKMKPAIRESVNRLYTMVEALRRGEAENIVLKAWTSLDFSYGYESLLGKANRRNIHLEVPLQPFERIYIDHHRFERAWINLTSNALEFANTWVRVQAEKKFDDLIVRVVDDGPGVPTDFIPRLFQRGASHGKMDGTGLGLEYVKQIIRGHGGDVRYYREDNLTVFECFIPNTFESNPMAAKVQSTVKPESKEPLRRDIGIVFRSPLLCSDILDRLSRVEARSILWHQGFNQGYDFIITDDPSIVEKCIDEGISVAEFSPDTPANKIVKKTLIRLGIHQSEMIRDA